MVQPASGQLMLLLKSSEAIFSNSSCIAEICFDSHTSAPWIVKSHCNLLSRKTSCMLIRIFRPVMCTCCYYIRRFHMKGKERSLAYSKIIASLCDMPLTMASDLVSNSTASHGHAS